MNSDVSLTRATGAPKTPLGSALRAVMRYEWLILKADRIAQTVVLLFLVIIICSLFNGFSAYNRQQQKVHEGSLEQQNLFDRTRDEIEQAEKERLAKGESLNLLRSGIPSPAAVYNKITNFKATLPVGSLAMLSVGQSDLYPQTFAYKTGARFAPLYPTVDSRSLSGFFPERSTDNPLLMLLGQFDLAFALLYIYPLIILALGFNMLTGDKEAGILALALSQPVSLRTLLLGKIAVRFLLVFAVGVVLPIFLTLIFLAFFDQEKLAGRLIFQLSFWALATVLYGVFWFALVLLINAIGKSTAANAVISVVAWIAFVVLIPALVNLTVQLSSPSLSTFSYVTEERKASLEINARIDAATASLNQLVRARYPVSSGDKIGQERYDNGYFHEAIQLPIGGEMLYEFVGERPEWANARTPNQLHRALFEIRRSRVAKRVAPILEEARARRAGQKTLMSFLRFTSPTILAQSVLSETAETGSERHERFLKHLDEYIRGREGFFTAKFLKNENIQSREFGDLQVFKYHEEVFAGTIKRNLLPIAGLIIFPLILIIWTTFLYRRIRF